MIPLLGSCGITFAVLCEQSPQAVNLRSAKLHQLLAHPMQRQHRLLLFALERHRLDLWLLYCHPDPARIRRVVLVADHKGGFTLCADINFTS